VDLGELQELINLLEASNLYEMEIEEEGRRVRLSKMPPHGLPAPMHFLAGETPRAAAPQAGSPSAAEGVRANGLLTIDSPMVGTFYAAPEPGKPPFVLPGDTVEADQTVCIIEAMKVMNEVVAKVPAIIERVLVENGDPVEFGQPLFKVDTRG